MSGDSNQSGVGDFKLEHEDAKKRINRGFGMYSIPVDDKVTKFEVGKERMGKTLNTMFDVKSAYPYGFGELKCSKPTFWDNVMESITEKRISLLDLGLILTFMALLTTLTTILIGVFT